MKSRIIANKITRSCIFGKRFKTRLDVKNDKICHISASFLRSSSFLTSKRVFNLFPKMQLLVILFDLKTDCPN